VSGPCTDSERGSEDPKIQLLVAEYTWVAGLIRYYREVELKALAGTGLVLSGIGAAFAALRASDNPDAIHALGVVFAIGAAVTAFALPVVLMANMRGMRATVYVREWLHPLAAEATKDPRFLAWESVAPVLYKKLAGRFGAVLRAVMSAAVVVFLIGMASLALAVLALTIEETTASQIIGAGAAACDLIFMGAALWFAYVSEKRTNIPDDLEPELHRIAARSARVRS
jgi:hypothetical protein